MKKKSLLIIIIALVAVLSLFFIFEKQLIFTVKPLKKIRVGLYSFIKVFYKVFVKCYFHLLSESKNLSPSSLSLKA